jgi:hypothetical protein
VPRADVAALKRDLLNLRFLELDMLAHDGVVFAKAQLFRGVRAARVLFRHIVKAGVGRADELDLDGDWLGHDPYNFRIWMCVEARANGGWPRESQASPRH